MLTCLCENGEDKVTSVRETCWEGATMGIFMKCKYMRPNYDNSDYITVKLLSFLLSSVSLHLWPHLRSRGKKDCILTLLIKILLLFTMCVLAWDNKWGGLSKCCWLFVSQNWAFFFSLPFHFRAAGLFVKVWLLMKADRQPGAGCECWCKAGRTNVCTHTSILSPAARGDVKHNDVVRGCGRALCGATRKSWHRQGHSFVHKNTRRITSESSTLTGYYTTCENNNGAGPSTESTFGLEWSPVFSKHSDCPHYSSHSIV